MSQDFSLSITIDSAVDELSGRIVRTERGKASPAIRIERNTPDSVRIVHHRPTTLPLYYVIKGGTLECATDPRRLLRSEAQVSALSHVSIVSLIAGVPLPPDATHVLGLRRLPLGMALTVRADGSITLGREPAEAPARPSDPHRALEYATIGALADLDQPYRIAYSGGLASTYLTLCAGVAGHAATLTHLTSGQFSPAPPPVDGRRLTVVHAADEAYPCEEHLRCWAPPLPEALLGQAEAAAASAPGEPVVSGALLETLLTADLDALSGELSARTLRGCELWAGTTDVRGLRQAMKGLTARRPHILRHRRIIGDRPDPPTTLPMVDDNSHHPSAGSSPPTSIAAGAMLTPPGWDLLTSGYTIGQSAWDDHLQSLDPIYARLETALDRQGLAWPTAGDGRAGQIVLPALDTRVIAAAAALPANRLATVGDGMFVNHMPLRDLLTLRGVTETRRSGSAFQTRLAAARIVNRHRERFAKDILNGSALADLGLISAPAVAAALRDAPGCTDQALPLLRLMWIDRWIRG